MSPATSSIHIHIHIHPHPSTSTSIFTSSCPRYYSVVALEYLVLSPRFRDPSPFTLANLINPLFQKHSLPTESCYPAQINNSLPHSFGTATTIISKKNYKIHSLSSSTLNPQPSILNPQPSLLLLPAIPRLNLFIKNRVNVKSISISTSTQFSNHQEIIIIDYTPN
ncbi:hypothetical protein EYC84_002727 [Monilinia fructicola]|uniref:Uncharacterized protein n=1 Tax=Monilinia fructicola TaxID=38448 RepID=A0A5M9JRM7_MONFR|nr:hypothetical protein EYC84_002727 [Monilinia fructicola]